LFRRRLKDARCGPSRARRGGHRWPLPVSRRRQQNLTSACSQSYRTLGISVAGHGPMFLVPSPEVPWPGKDPSKWQLWPVQLAVTGNLSPFPKLFSVRLTRLLLTRPTKSSVTAPRLPLRLPRLSRSRCLFRFRSASTSSVPPRNWFHGFSGFRPRRLCLPVRTRSTTCRLTATTAESR
jgi:hypothetical protein